MKAVILKVLWVLVILLPILFWYLIYQAWTLEYDQNIASLILAFFVSVITSIFLFLLRINDRINFNKQKLIRLYSNLLGTPIALIFIWIYVSVFQMNFEGSGSSGDGTNFYSYQKHRNYFKAKNLLVIEDFQKAPDTLLATIKRNGKIISLNRIANGDTLKLQNEEINFLTNEQKRELLYY